MSKNLLEQAEEARDNERLQRLQRAKNQELVTTHLVDMYAKREMAEAFKESWLHQTEGTAWTHFSTTWGLSPVPVYDSTTHNRVDWEESDDSDHLTVIQWWYEENTRVCVAYAQDIVFNEGAIHPVTLEPIILQAPYTHTSLLKSLTPLSLVRSSRMIEKLSELHPITLNDSILTEHPKTPSGTSHTSSW